MDKIHHVAIQVPNISDAVDWYLDNFHTIGSTSPGDTILGFKKRDGSQATITCQQGNYGAGYVIYNLVVIIP